ncbi:hypothetical protein N7493_008419 [Penicillium malachiteum]|uniref:Nuclear pore complex component n=1 Tax=Penicillium malachiteum TaxID=1324776 RepID=A0AAD6HHH9_9EURO|nr:hypothetical protein N7493_008419 [Penicillium malachiteum]
MATSLPSTPKPAQAAAPFSVESGTPGKWRHPHLNEIVRRQNAATFSDKNLRKVIWNGGALILTWVFGNGLKARSVCETTNSATHELTLSLSSSRPIFDNNSTYSEFTLLLVQLFFAANVLIALYPLFRPKDDLSDIPLTPTQRALLGLDPTATPPGTPGTTYVTPPRYRVSTSRKGSPASQSGSPLSATPTFSERRGSSSTPFSPITSPLFHKAVANGGRETGRRQSFGSSSTFGRSTGSFGESTMSTMSSIGPSTPSPLSGKRTSLGLSNKWLYERSRRLSASNGSL